MAGRIGAADMEFWTSKLEGAATFQLPSDYPVPENAQFAESELVHDVPDVTCKQILKHSMATDVTPFSIVLTSLAIMIHKVCACSLCVICFVFVSPMSIPCICFECRQQ